MPDLLPNVLERNFNIKDALGPNPEYFENIAYEVSAILVDLGCISFRPDQPYRYNTDIVSPVYIDNRLILANPYEREQIAGWLTDLVKETPKPDVVAATATAGIPHATLVADNLYLPMVYVRPTPKEYGKQNTIEGKLSKGQRVIVIDDLISTGRSALAVVDEIRKSGGVVNDVVAITTYGLNEADANFKKNNVKLHTLTDLKHLCQAALTKGLINQQSIDIIFDWAQNPKTWIKPN